MKITRRHLRYLIRETRDGSGDLGNYVFPNKRRRKDSIGVGEPDTHLEEYLEYWLRKYFYENTPIPRDASDELERFAKSGDYPDIFKFYNQGNAYRGMSVTKEFFEDNYGDLPPPAVWYSSPLNWWKNRSSKKLTGVSLSPLTRPGYVESMDLPQGTHLAGWSTDINIAKEQARVGAYSNKSLLPVVLSASSKNNTFIDATPFYNFDFQPEYRKAEQEVFSIGDVTLDEIYVYTNIKG